MEFILYHIDKKAEFNRNLFGRLADLNEFVQYRRYCFPRDIPPSVSTRKINNKKICGENDWAFKIVLSQCLHEMLCFNVTNFTVFKVHKQSKCLGENEILTTGVLIDQKYITVFFTSFDLYGDQTKPPSFCFLVTGTD